MYEELVQGNIFRAIASVEEKREGGRASNRYHLCGLTAAITLDCSLKTTLFALLGDKVIMHLCRS